MKELDKLIKTENRGTDRYLAIESARFYWWRRCQCESGKVVDQGGEKAIIEYLATGYDNSQWAKGKYSDIPIPNKRDFKTGDCFSTTDFKKTVDHSDCQSINYSTQEDPQRYISQYMIYRCMCEKGVNSENEENQLIAFMDLNYKNAKSYYTGKSLNLPRPLKKCPIANFKSGGSSAQSSMQQQITKRFANYQKAKSFERQATQIAEKYSDDVKALSKLSNTSDPQVLIEEFNSKMNQLQLLEKQNKEDNIYQISTTLNSAVIDATSGNHEGSFFSTLSLIEQIEVQKEAKRIALEERQRLINQKEVKMSQFYWKAEEINNNAIDTYFKLAAFSIDKQEEEKHLAYAKNLQCYGYQMDRYFNYKNTNWLKNNCPLKNNTESNLLIATTEKNDMNIAQHKYDLYLQTGNRFFLESSVKFAGNAVNKHPSSANLYKMGYFSKDFNSLLAYTCFKAVLEKSPNYFKGEKKSDFDLVQLSVEREIKYILNSEDKALINTLIESKANNSLTIDDEPLLSYAIKHDRIVAVQLLINSMVTNSDKSKEELIKDAMILASSYNSTKTIDVLYKQGFSVAFSVGNSSPFQAAERSISIDALKQLADLTNNNELYNNNLSNQTSDIYRVISFINSSSNLETGFNSYLKIESQKGKEVALRHLFANKNDELILKILIEAPSNRGIAKSFLSYPYIQDELHWIDAVKSNTKDAYLEYLIFSKIKRLNKSHRREAISKVVNFESNPCYFAARKKDKYGYFNRKKELIIPYQFDEAGPFLCGLALVKKGTRYGFINTKGEIVHDFLYSFAGKFSNGKCLAAIGRNSYILFSDGTRKDLSGNQLFLPGADFYINSNNKGEAMVDYNGKVLTDRNYQFIEKKRSVHYSTKGCVVRNLDTYKFGFINNRGDLIIPCIYDYIDISGMNEFGVKKDGLWGVLDASGGEIIPLKYDAIRNLSEGIRFIEKNDKWGALDEFGNLIINFQYDDVRNFEKGVAQVKKGKEWYFISLENKKLNFRSLDYSITYRSSKNGFYAEAYTSTPSKTLHYAEIGRTVNKFSNDLNKWNYYINDGSNDKKIILKAITSVSHDLIEIEYEGKTYTFDVLGNLIN